MLVHDCMTRDPVTIGPDTPLYDALNVMRSRRVHRLPVVEDGLLAGIVLGFKGFIEEVVIERKMKRA